MFCFTKKTICTEQRHVDVDGILQVLLSIKCPVRLRAQGVMSQSVPTPPQVTSVMTHTHIPATIDYTPTLSR